jgi:RNase P subunit RPR2
MDIEKIYCLKCKKKTDTTNYKKTKTKNNRNIIKGTCKICGTKKSLFIK